MKIDFIYASELKEKFKCYGHFYNIKFLDGRVIECRSILEITEANLPDYKCKLLWKKRADAVFIMMNPGSSYPIEPIKKDLRTKECDFNNTKFLSLTRPDNTQYQVMRIALECGWSHIRVLNLSDIRESKSFSFIKTLESFCQNPQQNIHSIFSDERSDECKAALNRYEDNIIVGWGQNKGLIPLASQCFKKLKKQSLVMTGALKNGLLNMHPSPMLQKKKEEWLYNILDQLS